MKEKLLVITLEDKTEDCGVEDMCVGGCNSPSIEVCKKCYCVECTRHTCKPILPKGWRYKA